ncbi:hypothetical protein AB4Y44_13265 [Paraburkholderia sp. BR10937]|uniref:hypothetical protein n=1 Tax=Paraburkholderia sp. BR10937 TaxID=3236994 RepID=UPI0034D1B3D8
MSLVRGGLRWRIVAALRLRRLPGGEARLGRLDVEREAKFRRLGGPKAFAFQVIEMLQHLGSRAWPWRLLREGGGGRESQFDGDYRENTQIHIAEPAV